MSIFLILVHVKLCGSTETIGQNLSSIFTRIGVTKMSCMSVTLILNPLLPGFKLFEELTLDLDISHRDRQNMIFNEKYSWIMAWQP